MFGRYRGVLPGTLKKRPVGAELVRPCFKSAAFPSKSDFEQSGRQVVSQFESEA